MNDIVIDIYVVFGLNRHLISVIQSVSPPKKESIPLQGIHRPKNGLECGIKPLNLDFEKKKNGKKWKKKPLGVL